MTQNQGVDQLEGEIEAYLFFDEGIETGRGNVMVNARHIGLLNQASSALDDVMSGIAAGMPVDLVQIDMTRCWNKLVKLPVIVTRTNCWINSSVSFVLVVSKRENLFRRKQHAWDSSLSRQRLWRHCRWCRPCWVEAALAAARMGNKTLLMTINLDMVAFMPCNPSVGGPVKGIVGVKLTHLAVKWPRILIKPTFRCGCSTRVRDRLSGLYVPQADKHAYHGDEAYRKKNST